MGLGASRRRNGAKVVVNNETKNGISPAHEKASEGSNEGDNHSGRDADQPEEHESDPVGPDGDGVA